MPLKVHFGAKTHTYKETITGSTGLKEISTFKLLPTELRCTCIESNLMYLPF